MKRQHHIVFTLFYISRRIWLDKTLKKNSAGCTKDMPGEGFFAATIKMPTGKERTKQVNVDST